MNTQTKQKHTGLFYISPKKKKKNSIILILNVKKLHVGQAVYPKSKSNIKYMRLVLARIKAPSCQIIPIMLWAYSSSSSRMVRDYTLTVSSSCLRDLLTAKNRFA